MGGCSVADRGWSAAQCRAGGISAGGKMNGGDRRLHWLKLADAWNWNAVLSDLEHHDFPDPLCLSKALKGSGPIPEKVRAWLASYFEAGMPRPPRGRRPRH